jgi:serine/threonine-protein kinase
MTQPEEHIHNRDNEITCSTCNTHFFLGQSSAPPSFCPFCGNSLTQSKTQEPTQPSISTKFRGTEGAVSLVEGQAPSNEPVQFEIGAYQVLRSIGKGGMGEVFLAYDTSCGRRIALKKIRSDLEKHAQLYSRFLK